LRCRTLEQAKPAVLNSPTSRSGQQTYDRAIDDFVDLYCSAPRLAFLGASLAPAVKLIFPVFFLIFPSVLLVTLGRAAPQ
jgi:hypothetical protein